MAPSPIERVSPAAREALLAAGRRRRYERRQVVFHAGDEGDSVHLIEEGRVAVKATTEAGQDVALSVMGPGELFGELAVFGRRGERTAGVVALEDVTTLELRRGPFDSVRAEHPEVNDLFLNLLAERCDRLTGLVQEVCFVSVQQRVARRLFEVGRSFLDGTMPVVVPLTQDEVAELAGTTRPTANAALQTLQERGAIRLARGRVEILSPRALKTAAGWG